MNVLFFLWVVLGGGHLVYAQPAELPIIASRYLFDIKANFLHPSDVTVGSQGRIYVLDGVNHAVKVVVLRAELPPNVTPPSALIVPVTGPSIWRIRGTDSSRSLMRRGISDFNFP